MDVSGTSILLFFILCAAIFIGACIISIWRGRNYDEGADE